MTGFQVLNVVCAVPFIALWIVAMWKGNEFLAMPAWQRLLITLSVVAAMTAWIVYDHAHVGAQP